MTFILISDPCPRRLFLDYHGLKLLWGWMVDAAAAGNSADSIQFKIDLLTSLASLPVPNKTMLLDSKLITIVEKWAIPSEPSTTAVVVKKEEASADTLREPEVRRDVAVKIEDLNRDDVVREDGGVHTTESERDNVSDSVSDACEPVVKKESTSDGIADPTTDSPETPIVSNASEPVLLDKEDSSENATPSENQTGSAHQVLSF